MSNKIKWRKIGGGSFRMGKRIIKPNQTFEAAVSEIPQAFKDVVVPLNDLPPEEKPIVVDSTFEIVPRGERYEGDEISASECKAKESYYLVVETKDGDKDIEAVCKRVNKTTVVFDSVDGEEYKVPSGEIVKTLGDELFNVVNSATGKEVNNEPLTKEEAETLLQELS